MKAKLEIDQLEEQLRAGHAGRFIDAVADAIARNADTVMFTFAVFAGEPELLYGALRYASLRGITVTVVSHPEAA